MKAVTLALASVLLVASVARADSPDPQIDATVEAFHVALKKGESAAVMALLAPDAQILEGGHTESRAEYEKGHLASDIEFARAVPGTRENIVVRQEGSVAWATSTSRVTGTFKGREVNSAGAELMVLTKMPDGWRIRAIHWSSHALKK
ncbi:MAG: hypothetical protein AVDCRST_MAG42-1329 [uncultured Chthoniobacterales bacterium]|uniref:DUF4440 domain-containing protein n=1 Tax=uncultured Chthoniobacterales bacterium TaxID=1836801 RepID=A0A6J4HVL5_9BACT|nr:MAG: hypothetical protein AVDCRST_MAG42-1329 [uncultured Chthoniobacterales bacterium]